MEAVIKFNVIDECEADWSLEEYANGKFQNLTDEDLKAFISQIIREAIANNGVYYDSDDAERAIEELIPTISSIILDPRFAHLKMDYTLIVELITYLTIRLA